MIAQSLAWFKDRFFFIITTLTISAVSLGSPLNVKHEKNYSGFGSLTYQFSLGNYNIADLNDGYHSLVLTDTLSPTQELGKPQSFTTGSLIIIPEGYKAVITILNQETTSHDGITLNPVQAKHRCSHVQPTFTIDQTLYHSSSVYPEQVVKIESLGKLGQITLGRVGITPLQMDYAHDRVLVTKHLSFRVNFERLSQAPIKVNSENRTIKAIAQAVSENAADFVNLPDLNSPEIYLMIAADELVDGVQPLAAWKQQLGYAVQIVKRSEAGATANAVKQYIENLYNSSSGALSHVLLIGNKHNMPPFYKSTSGGSAASDYPFTLVSGNDVIPDLLIGRIVADNAAEVTRQVRRFIAYEQTLNSQATWLNQGTTIASNEGGDEKYAQRVEEPMLAHSYSHIDRFYQRQRTATAANISNALVEGRSWLTYIGHGSGTSWGSTNTTFSTQTISKLENFERLPVIVDVACDNGGFQNYSRCFGKAWVTTENNNLPVGAVAYYGASVSTSWDPPAVMAVGAAKYHFEKALQSVGATVLAGQLYLIEEMGTGSSIIENLEWYNLFGEPALTMHTGLIQDYQHNFEVQVEESNVKLQVQLNLPAGPLSGAKISVTEPPNYEVISLGQTDTLGHAELVINRPSLTGLLLTISGYNIALTQVPLATYQDVVQSE